AERFKLSVHRENREHPVYEMVAAKGELKLKPSEPEDDTPGPGAAGGAGPDAPVPGFFLGGGIGAGASNVRVSADGRGMVVTGGPNGTMRVSPGSNGGMRLEMSKVAMPALADMLAPFTDRTVVDRTELKGTYQVTLDLPMEALLSMVQNAARTAGLPVAGLAGGAGGRLGGLGGGLIPGVGVGTPLAGAASDPSGASILQAIQQLGLKLEARKAQVETVVVDHLEKTPTEN
ncbi:MAG: TIGR03435 family protein, partial [Acidobacteria bacterium]|nr:TIGR03435 family protein [Acidobacteriota bacterium]